MLNEAQAQFGLRLANACRRLGVHCALLRYVPRRAEPPALRARLHALAAQKPRWGAPRLTWGCGARASS